MSLAITRLCGLCRERYFTDSKRTVIKTKSEVQKVKGFIEVTDYDGGMKVLCPIQKITGIVCDGDGSVFIEMGTDKGGESSGILVCESFDEIKAKIEKCEV